MDQAVYVEENVESSSVGEKRPAENGAASPSKRPRCGDMKRVAEMVLVLSAMGRIRGGAKRPTEAEVRLMAEAREMLAEMCAEMAPKDFVGRDAVGAVIEELGLNGKSKEQRLGFRASRLTISEKLALSQKKVLELQICFQMVKVECSSFLRFVVISCTAIPLEAIVGFVILILC